MKVFFKRFLEYMVTNFITYFMIAFVIVIFNLMTMAILITDDINNAFNDVKALSILSLVLLVATVISLPEFFRVVVAGDKK